MQRVVGNQIVNNNVVVVFCCCAQVCDLYSGIAQRLALRQSVLAAKARMVEIAQQL